MNPISSINRRTFVSQTATVIAATAMRTNLLALGEAPVSHQAMGTRVGEVTTNSAVVWTRLTAISKRRDPANVKVEEGQVDFLEGACPGAPGRVRLRFGTEADLSAAETTPWKDVGEEDDFIHQFPLSGLKEDMIYHFESETSGADGTAHGTIRGKFRTAPAASRASELVFCVMTCQGYNDKGHPDGHAIYPAMLAMNPSFACLTGDLVYYDNDKPSATSPQLARYHWQRMFSLPRLVEFNRNLGCYWLKDDHDTLNNDSWPGQKMGSFTFSEGQRIFRQQAPMRDGPSYRTFRWGRDLQIWLTDGRDFRSPNNKPDGPEKTIWGTEQKAWFQRTMLESDATWKILISPTPMVGPDRKGKNDNHANEGFQHEGDEMRAWFKANVPENFIVICGDRHWQYHSVHPQSGLREFSVGAASDEHAGGSPGKNPEYHRFHRVKGGFLSATLGHAAGKSKILIQLHDVNGGIVHEWSAERSV